MNRTELVDAVGERLGDRRTAGLAVDAVLDAVTTALSDGQKVSLFGFGVFERVERAARTARNPATGGTVEVPAAAVPRFRPGQTLKDAVNGRSTGAAQRRASPAGARATAASTEAVSARPGRSSGGEGAGGGRSDGRKADGTKADRRKADGRKADGKKTDRKKADRKADGRKADRKADAKKTDAKTPRKKTDGKADGRKRAGKAGGTKATRARTG